MSDCSLGSFESYILSCLDELSNSDNDFDRYTVLRKISNRSNSEITELVSKDGKTYSSRLQTLIECQVERELGSSNPDVTRLYRTPDKYKRYSEIMRIVKRNCKSKTKVLTRDEYLSALKILKDEFNIQITDEFSV